MGNKKIKKMWGHWLDDKKWVKFVGMQQNNATLMCDLNTMKDTVESYLKKMHSQNINVLSLINHA